MNRILDEITHDLRPNYIPSLSPSPSPSLNPSPSPSLNPSPNPSLNPSPNPSLNPSLNPCPSLNPRPPPSPHHHLFPTLCPSQLTPHQILAPYFRRSLPLHPLPFPTPGLLLEKPHPLQYLGESSLPRTPTPSR